MKLQFERQDCVKLAVMLAAVLCVVFGVLCRPMVVRAENSGYSGKADKVWAVYYDSRSSSTFYKNYDAVAVHGDLSHILGSVMVLVPYPVASDERYYACGYVFSDSKELDVDARTHQFVSDSYVAPIDQNYKFTDSAGSMTEWRDIKDNGTTYYYQSCIEGFYHSTKRPEYDDHFDYVVVLNAPKDAALNYEDIAFSVLMGHVPDGVEVEKQPENTVDDLVIHGLESYENQDSVLTGLTTYVTWDALGGDTYDASKLYLEAKISFSTQNKQTKEKKSYTDVPLKAMSDGVKDSAGEFSFVNYDFLAGYCSANGIDDTNLLYTTDNIYCRYAYDGPDGVVYGEWQRVGDVIPTIDDADYSADIEIENLIYKELHPSTGKYQHYISFDKKDSYDANTYLLVNADIKWKPALNKTNVATYVPIVEKGDKYLASSGEWSIDVDQVWKGYFDKEGINYSAFSSQWTDKLYFQIVKYSESEGKWYSSNVYRVDLNQQTTGVVGTVREVNPGRFDKDTGTFIKGKFDNKGTFVPGNDGSYYVDGSTGQIVENAYGGIFDGIELPEGSTIIDYITALGKAFITSISSLLSSVGQIPKMIGSVLSFLPAELITLIGIGIIVAIILRVLGR
ncbi:hypothetical protein [Eisenbergiella sp.]